MSTSPAYELLHPRVQRWVWTQGWRELRDIQELAVEPILAHERDVIVAAATAAGKTEAAFLPIASRLLTEERPSVRALYVSPLKALINDQHRRLEEICDEIGLAVHRWHGDVGAGHKRAVLEDPSGVLLITPESLEALFVLRGTKLRELFAHLEYVVIDELHSFLGTDRGRQLQSLVDRLELAIRRRVPRVGLSATLGDLRLAAEFLRRESPADVTIVESRGGDHELRLQVRAYEEPLGLVDAPAETNAGAATSAATAITAHLFEHLRGDSHLVFANTRRDVEEYAARLRDACEKRHLPNEFFPHHGSLSKALREEVEAALRDGSSPHTVVCTSTLEMGIDLGDVATVAQLGPPPSVASLRQRLGRSGRRGKPSVLRVYVRERAIGPETPLQDRLREELAQSLAMAELVLEGWCEPPVHGALRLSTLIQQVLSVIAQHSGVRADQAYEVLCETGPFGGVDEITFAALLRSMGAHDLITQDERGVLLTGLAGEEIVDDYRFYAVFDTPEEYRVVYSGNELGTVPIKTALVLGSGLVLAGERWRVTGVDEYHREILVARGSAGDPPLFEGGGGDVHDEVRARMRRILEGDSELHWISEEANRLLAEARQAYTGAGLDRARIVADGADALLFLWAGDRVLNTVSVALAAGGAKVDQDGMVLRVERTDEAELWRRLGDLENDGVGEPLELARTVAVKRSAKYDEFLAEELLAADYASRALDVLGALLAIQRALSGE